MVQGSAFWTLIWSLDWRKIGRFYCFKATPSFTWESSVLDLSESLTSFIFLSWAELIQRNVGSFSSEHICGGKTDSIWFLTSVFCFRTFVAGFLTLTVSAILWKPQENPYPGRGGPPIQPETDPGHDDYQTGGYVDLVGVAGLVPKFSVLPASALESRDSSPVSWVQEEFFCGKRVSYSPITLLDLVESAKRKRKLQRTKQVCHFKKGYWDRMELD